MAHRLAQLVLLKTSVAELKAVPFQYFEYEEDRAWRSRGNQRSTGACHVNSPLPRYPGQPKVRWCIARWPQRVQADHVPRSVVPGWSRLRESMSQKTQRALGPNIGSQTSSKAEPMAGAAWKDCDNCRENCSWYRRGRGARTPGSFVISRRSFNNRGGARKRRA